jgi:hypothetical protein
MDHLKWALFVVSAAFGGAIFWLASYPPMIDLPQHAGQGALLRDLVLGRSPWTETMQVHLFTPYLIGYGLALPFSLILPVATALKVLLSLAYAGFVFMCVILRRHFGSDARLDWLFLPGFFGFAYAWGLLTFLVAAPIGLCFILVASRYTHERSLGRATMVIALGLVLLASHALVFLLGWTVGVLLLGVRMPPQRRWVSAALPFAVLALACACCSSRAEPSSKNSGPLPAGGSILTMACSDCPRYTVHRRLQIQPAIIVVAVVLLSIPWLLGMRIGSRRSGVWVPFVVVALIMTIAPSSGFKTALLYERFALFLLPAYAWMFTTERSLDGAPRPARGWGARIAMPLLVVACWAVLGFNAIQTWRFGQEAADFDAVLDSVQPGQRALALVFDPGSEAARNPYVYQHYASWYQAERQGLVDFNFAWFPPQIVRFRPGHLPSVGTGFDLIRENSTGWNTVVTTTGIFSCGGLGLFRPTFSLAQTVHRLSCRHAAAGRFSSAVVIAPDFNSAGASHRGRT